MSKPTADDVRKLAVEDPAKIDAMLARATGYFLDGPDADGDRCWHTPSGGLCDMPNFLAVPVDGALVWRLIDAIQQHTGNKWTPFKALALDEPNGHPAVALACALADLEMLEEADHA